MWKLSKSFGNDWSSHHSQQNSEHGVPISKYFEVQWLFLGITECNKSTKTGRQEDKIMIATGQKHWAKLIAWLGLKALFHSASFVRLEIAGI